MALPYHLMIPPTRNTEVKELFSMVASKNCKTILHLSWHLPVQIEKQILHEKKNFCLTKICEKDRKYHIFISCSMFLFHGNIIFPELSVKRKYKKAASFCKCVFLRKYEIFAYDSWTERLNFQCRIVTKTSDFSLAFRSTFRWRYLRENMKFYVLLQRKQTIGQLFVEDLYVFPISHRTRDRRIENLFFSSFMAINARSF